MRVPAKLQTKVVLETQRSLSDSSPKRTGTARQLHHQQRSSADNYVATTVPGGLKSHMFPVLPFASVGHPFVTSRAQAQVQGFREHLGALQGLQAYYAAQRAKAPPGTTTPQVQQDDWKLAEEILNVLTTFPDFHQLPQQLRNSIEALKPLLGQPGQARYSAWTAMCRVLENTRHAGNQAPSAQSAPLKREVSAPAAAPQRKPARSCQAACQELARYSEGIRKVSGRQQVNWPKVRGLLRGIVASGDFKTRFSPQQQSVFTDLQRLNAKNSGLPGRFDAWQAVQSLLSQDAGSPRAPMSELRRCLSDMLERDVWMTSDTDALTQLCRTERFKSGCDSKLYSKMQAVEVAVRGGTQDARNHMADLLAALNQQFPPA